VRDIALKINQGIQVKRAKFSNIERAHILQAAQRPVDLDERQAQAVSARIELDLRIGAAFTRWQTVALRNVRGLDNMLISYGGLGFCFYFIFEFGRETFIDGGKEGRLMSVPDTGFRRRSISLCQELCAGAFLEHRCDPQTRRHRGEIPLGPPQTVRSDVGHHPS
jgi:hypothetical protein